MVMSMACGLQKHDLVVIDAIRRLHSRDWIRRKLVVIAVERADVPMVSFSEALRAGRAYFGVSARGMCNMQQTPCRWMQMAIRWCQRQPSYGIVIQTASRITLAQWRADHLALWASTDDGVKHYVAKTYAVYTVGIGGLMPAYGPVIPTDATAL